MKENSLLTSEAIRELCTHSGLLDVAIDSRSAWVSMSISHHYQSASQTFGFLSFRLGLSTAGSRLVAFVFRIPCSVFLYVYDSHWLRKLLPTTGYSTVTIPKMSPRLSSTPLQLNRPVPLSVSFAEWSSATHNIHTLKMYVQTRAC